MKPRAAVVDYGMGNLYSVTKALEHCGADVILSAKPRDFVNIERIVLPGVGAFSDGMRELRDRGFVEMLRKFAQGGGKLLGICLGMQMLMQTSEEFGLHEGLGLIPGRVAAIPAESSLKRRKIPHVGWSPLHASGGESRWHGTILESLHEGDSVYFVHSFTAIPENEEHLLADSDYDGYRVAAVIGKEQVFGCQFHPEKSGKTGLKIIERFLTL